MSFVNPLRVEAAVASVLAGAFLGVGHLLNYGAAEYGTVAGTMLVFAAHVLLVVGFLGAHIHQSSSTGILGRAGTLLASIGTVVVSAIVFVELAGATGVTVAPVFGSTATAPFVAVGPLAFVVGMLAFGAATVRARTFPAVSGWLLIVGTVVFAAGTVAGEFTDPVTIVGALLTGAGFISLGVALVRSSADTTTPLAEVPVRP